ncbi:EamA domain-containing membrane protein RarD [Novosphingobium panipatense]|uniref:EamA domain-containing membrane protein RarD n=2 Tax=Novosphingobium panipatense TaxID=428991 RepID=A0ABY1Q345_9SPHN|nr:EamA domain-containing membrane protein RarD [Novosphingobium panipatense]
MVALATMFMLAKLAGEAGVSVAEIVFWRQGMAVPIILGWLAATGQLTAIRTRRLRNHALRATTGTLGLCCNIGAATLLPLSLGTTLGFTAPLFAVLVTAFVLRERVGPWRWTAVLLGFLGVIAIAQPSGEAMPAIGVAAGLGAGLVVAIVSFQIRDLSRTETPIACVFWFSFFGALLAAFLLPIYGSAHGTREWLLLFSIGLAGTIAQFLITSALRFGQVATVVVMDYTTLIWATLYGWAIWGHLPSASMWLGAPMIIAAGLIITSREHFLSRRVSPASALDESATRDIQGT